MACVIILFVISCNYFHCLIHCFYMMGKGEELATLFSVVSLAYLFRAYCLI